MARARKVDGAGKTTGVSSRRALVLAAVAIVLLKQFVPFGLGGVVLYPFTLLATWVHEMGHGIAALLAGGRFERLEIFWNASGLAHTSGYAGTAGGFVAAAGLLGPPIAGGAILAFARGPRRARTILWAIAVALFLSLVIWVRSPVGFAVACVIVALLVWVSLKWSDTRRLWLAQFIGLLFGLDTVSRIDYLFTRGVVIGGEPLKSDVASVADAWGGSYLMWGLLLATISLGAVALGLWIAWRRPAGAVAPPSKRVLRAT
jgi:hypothetical protein